MSDPVEMDEAYFDTGALGRASPILTANSMSLRDWFAGQALAGILANGDISASAARLKVGTSDFRTDVVRTAFEIADAMITKRAK